MGPARDRGGERRARQPHASANGAFRNRGPEGRRVLGDRLWRSLGPGGLVALDRSETRQRGGLACEGEFDARQRTGQGRGYRARSRTSLGAALVAGLAMLGVVTARIGRGF